MKEGIRYGVGGTRYWTGGTGYWVDVYSESNLPRHNTTRVERSHIQPSHLHLLRD